MAHYMSPAALFNVKGWTCLVTGGGTGIGLMATQALAAAGAKVYIAGRRLEVLQKTAEIHSKGIEGSIIPIQMDQTDPQSIENAYQQISSKESCLNLLINNAGLASKRADVNQVEKGAEAFKKAMLRVPFENWDEVYKANVYGYYLTSATFLPLLAKANKPDEKHKLEKDWSANIINISSISGITKKTQNGQFIYNSSKAATIQLTNLLASEFSNPALSIRVNSIAPGYFPSEMTTSGSDENNKSHADPEGWRSEKLVPCDRPGDDQDMAQAVMMLACNRYVNGQTIVVDGGLLLDMP